MKDKRRDARQKARNYAFLLLKFRPRSEKELYARLKSKKFDEGVIRETTAFLKEKSFLDDNSFARTWIEYRLKKPLGLRRIEQELKLKGVDKEIIKSQLQAVRDGYSEEDVVLKLAKERLVKSRGLEPNKARQRIFAYLLRRGFSPGIVIDTVKQL